MRDSLPSISLASLSTVIATEIGMSLLTTITLAFIGGVVGYFAKVFAQWIHRKLKP